MKILGVDTSTQNSGVCILEDEKVRLELSLDIDQTHSKHLMKMIMDGLDLVGCIPADIDGYAVVVGPGSFTGLRIGLSTIKGLAFDEHKPVAGVSSLEALAFQCGWMPYLVCSLLDARKKEVYSCLYRSANGFPRAMGQETVGPLEEVVDRIDEPCIFIGDGAVFYRKEITEKMGEKALFPFTLENRIKPACVAYMGYLKIRNAKGESIEDIKPRYIRPPDAKIKKRPQPL